MRKRDAEYHTGRLNISCPPSTKDAIAADATAHGQSISQFMLGMYKASTEAGSSAHLARMGLDLVGLKKRLIDVDTRLRRSLNRAQGPPCRRTSHVSGASRTRLTSPYARRLPR